MAIDTKIGQDPLQTFLIKVECVGTEESISLCPQDNKRVCLDPGAGVICPIQVNGSQL